MARAIRASASSALIVHSEKGFDSRKLDEGRIAHPPFGMPLPLRVQLWPAQNCSVQSRLPVAEPLPHYRDLGFCFLGSQAVLGRERWWRRDRSGGCPQTGRDRHGLLFACLEDMRQQGFGYAIIGGVGPAAYYSKAVGAAPLE